MASEPRLMGPGLWSLAVDLGLWDLACATEWFHFSFIYR